MGWFALLAGALGFAAVYFSRWTVPIWLGEYLSLAALAGIDSLIGGIRAGSEGKFKSNVFISGFVVNTMLAVFLAYLGERLGQNLALAAVVTLGYRIFVNLSIIRRHWLDVWDEAHHPAQPAAAARIAEPFAPPIDPGKKSAGERPLPG
jgi:small basic protein